MTIDKDDLSALKELADKGGAFSTLMYEYMMSLDGVELHSKVIEFLNKVDSIIYDLEKEKSDDEYENEERQTYSSSNPYFEVL
jgi:uncharacterized membrane protein YgaE (UPF0421/DUF939 family)